MNNNIILWQQATTAFGNSLLSHNGKCILPEDDQYAELLDQVIVCDFSSYRKLYSDEEIQLYIDKDRNYFILSNFVETDESNRQIAFIAKVRTSSRKEIITLLQKEALLYEKHITDKAQKTLCSALYAKEIIGFGLIAIIALITTLIVLILKYV